MRQLQVNSCCYGIPAAEIARRCGVSLKTATRWKTGATRMPKAAAMVLTEDLGDLDAAWKGWKLRNGKLVSREGWEASPGDVLSIPLLHAQVQAYQSKERVANAMEEQPLPDAISEQSLVLIPAS